MRGFITQYISSSTTSSAPSNGSISEKLDLDQIYNNWILEAESEDKRSDRKTIVEALRHHNSRLNEQGELVIPGGKLSLAHRNLTSFSLPLPVNNLSVLDLSSNQITTFDGLPTLAELRELYLSRNRITSFNGMPTLAKLKNLDLSDNQITTFDGMPTLAELRVLYLSDNQIDIISETLLRWSPLSDGSVRHVYLQDNPIPAAIGAQLEHIHQESRTQFQFSRHHDQRVATRIDTNNGTEANDILAFLRKTPNKPFFIRYPGPGIDQGGLTRQALNQAYRQSLQQSDLFCHEDNRYVFNTKKINSTTLQAAKDFGLILATIARESMAVGYHHHRTFFEQLHKTTTLPPNANAFKSVVEQATTDTVNMEWEDIEQYLLENKGDLLSLISHLDNRFSEGPTKAAFQGYFTGLCHEDQIRYAADIALPAIAVASGIEAVDASLLRDANQLELSICGCKDLKKSLLNNLIISDHRHDSNNNGESKRTLTAWMQRYLNEATEAQCQELCHEITGADSLTERDHPQLIIQNHMNNRGFTAHTCFKTMDVNANLLSGDYEHFKSTLEAHSKGKFTMG